MSSPEAPAPGAGLRALAGLPAAVWRRERRGRSYVYGPVYRSGYLNAFLAGRLEDGAELVVAAGVHARHYPFFHPRSKWDDLLLVAGEERLLISGRHVSGLGIALGPGEQATLSYHGRAFRASGAAVDVDLHLELRATLYRPRAEGLGFRYAVLGLQWQPALVAGRGSLTLNHRRRRIDRASGIMERGSLTHLRGRLFHFGLDYLAVAGSAEPAAAYVRFRTWALREGISALPLRLLLAGDVVAAEELTLGGKRPEHGDAHALAPAAGEAVEAALANRVHVGPARLTREILRIGEGERVRWGLRQRIEEAGG